MLKLSSKVVRYHFELQDKSPLIISYELFPSSLRSKWLDQIRARNAEPNTYLDLKISNKTAADLEYLLEKLNSFVIEINKYYDQQLPVFTDTKNLNHDTLNFLHEQFEIYGERNQDIIETQKLHLKKLGPADVWPGHRFRPEFHELWMKLNEYIHIIEMAMTNIGNTFPNFSCLVHVYPPVLGEPVTDTDRFFLDDSFKWGQLYLGYNTLGKDYMHAAHDDDARVIGNEQVKVQEYFSTEASLNFTEDMIVPNLNKILFYSWYDKQSQEVKNKIPINNLNKLALGRLHIGNVLLDNTFLSFEPDIKKWLYDIETKKRWNLKVFSKIESCKKIEIVE